jgi:hypothetical protein
VPTASTHFEDEGIRIVPCSADASTWELRLTLPGIGRPGSMDPVGPAAIRADYRR